jgi:hypothetical protein
MMIPGMVLLYMRGKKKWKGGGGEREGEEKGREKGKLNSR